MSVFWILHMRKYWWHRRLYEHVSAVMDHARIRSRAEKKVAGRAKRKAAGGAERKAAGRAERKAAGRGGCHFERAQDAPGSE